MNPKPRPRRSRGEARRHIVEAARVLFAQRGYDGTSFRDIAAQAQVAEALIYRSVGSKEQLFREAVIEPYHEFVSVFVGRWRKRKHPLSNQQMMDRFIRELYAMLKEHRELILALVAARAFGDADIDGGADSLLSLELDRLAEQTSVESAWRGFDDKSLGIVVRGVVGMVMSFVLLDDWLLPTGKRRPGERQLLQQVSRFALAGLEGARTSVGSAPRKAAKAGP